ncbi:hypothetical protein RF11_16218 [Thelohanellus kitauei]|uniref:Uncharacterized protein n=1 Tax=Thelohanellus kitauei TaxID=669202 RepID=A0A0C2IQL3_THEKT|nr:hypothetical protein RF11_16218 [Thelohanellus kitauei]
MDLNRSSRLNRVSYGNFSKATSLDIQINYFSGVFYDQIEIQLPYRNTTCQYICNPLIKKDDFCYCIDEVDTNKEYMCDDAKCLSPDMSYEYPDANMTAVLKMRSYMDNFTYITRL